MKHNIITERLGDEVTRLVIDVNHGTDEGVIRTWEAAAAVALESVTAYSPDESGDLMLDLAEIEDEIAGMRQNGPDLTSFMSIGGLAYGRVPMSDRSIVDLLARKQRDYGPGNILAFGEIGLMVRMSDKVARLQNLLAREDSTGVAEPTEDAWLDLVGYAVIARMLANDTFLLPLAEFALPWTDAEFKQLLHDVGTTLVGVAK